LPPLSALGQGLQAKPFGEIFGLEPWIVNELRELFGVTKPTITATAEITPGEKTKKQGDLIV